MKIRALIVDDDPILLKMLIAFLMKLDFEGNTAENGQEAVDKMREDRYDIVFMDIQMPVMDGIAATKIIKEEIDSNIPIIAVTSLDDFNYERSIQEGLDDYLKKPVSLDQLKEVIAKHCGQSN